jgi:hypothetical protein
MAPDHQGGGAPDVEIGDHALPIPDCSERVIPFETAVRWLGEAWVAGTSWAPND